MIIQSIKEYPGLYLILLAAVVGCGVLWGLALRASRKRRGKRDALIAQLEREAALRREFAGVTREKLIDTPAERLVEGLCVCIQARLEEQKDMREAYDALTEHERLVYALGYVIQDGRENLSGFFKVNGPPLTDDALEAVLRFLDEGAAGIFQREFRAFDERNETVSLVREIIDSLDAEWARLREEAGEAFYGEVKEFILANSGAFLL